MKIALLILNSMFLLLFISVVIGEWGKAPAVIAGMAIANCALNSIFIFLKTKNDFEELG